MVQELYIQFVNVNGYILHMSRNLSGIYCLAQTVKNLPAMQETWIQSLGQEDPLE